MRQRKQRKRVLALFVAAMLFVPTVPAYAEKVAAEEADRTALGDTEGEERKSVSDSNAGGPGNGTVSGDEGSKTSQPGSREDSTVGVEEGHVVLAEGADIASGKDGDIIWVIDSAGKLTISGIGDFTESPYTNPNLWGDYYDQIVSAEINVAGMKNVEYLFYNTTIGVIR